MTPAARAQAAIELVGLIEQSLRAQGQPADQLVHSFFKVRRYAGARDRAAVTEQVYGVLRRRAEWLWRLGAPSSPRLLVAIQYMLGDTAEDEDLANLFDGSSYGPDTLASEETEILDRARQAPNSVAPRWVTGNYPEWLDPHLTARFGDRLADEIAALNRRAPLDLRTNFLKANRLAVQAVLAEVGLAVIPTPWSPLGLRAEARARVTELAAFKNGLIEIQDEGSQVAALFADARPGMQVVDLCAGGGGKTLVLSAAMQNKGQIYAADADQRRLKKMIPRITRAGARNVQTCCLDAMASDVLQEDLLSYLNGRADRVLLDVPCSGTGAWRRNPDAKWRLTPDMLAYHVTRQDRLLARAARLTKPRGRLIYVTCSLLRDENEDRIEAFLAAHPTFQSVPAEEVWAETVGTSCPVSTAGQSFLFLTPHQHGTDGFFVAVLERETLGEVD